MTVMLNMTNMDYVVKLPAQVSAASGEGQLECSRVTTGQSIRGSCWLA